MSDLENQVFDTDEEIWDESKDVYEEFSDESEETYEDFSDESEETYDETFSDAAYDDSSASESTANTQSSVQNEQPFSTKQPSDLTLSYVVNDSSVPAAFDKFLYTYFTESDRREQFSPFANLNRRDFVTAFESVISTGTHKGTSIVLFQMLNDDSIPWADSYILTGAPPRALDLAELGTFTKGRLANTAQASFYVIYKLLNAINRIPASQEEGLSKPEYCFNVLISNLKTLGASDRLYLWLEDVVLGKSRFEPIKNIEEPVDITNTVSWQSIQVFINTTNKSLDAIYSNIFKFPFNGVLADFGGVSFFKRRQVAGSFENVSGLDLNINMAMVTTGLCSNNSLTIKVGKKEVSKSYTSILAKAPVLSEPVTAEGILRNGWEYIPEFHIDTLSGICGEQVNVFDYSKHKPVVHKKVENLFKELLLIPNMTKNMARLAEAASTLSKVLCNVVVLSKLSNASLLSGMILTSYRSMDIFELLTSKEFYDVHHMQFPNVAHEGNPGDFGTEPIHLLNSPEFVAIHLQNDMDSYKKEINFAYKAIDDLKLRGGKSDFSAVPFGINYATGLPVSVDLTKQDVFALSIYGGSGSGKGVLVLATMGTAIATGHPFIYLDCKPDTAAVLWGAAHKYGTNCLAVDSSFFTKGYKFANVRQEILPNALKAVQTKYESEPFESHALIKFFKEIRDFVARTTGDDIALPSKTSFETFATVMLICKFIGMSLLINNPTLSTSRLLAVVDECSAGQGNPFQSLIEANGVLDVTLRPMFKGVGAVYKDKKATDEDRNIAQRYYRQLARLCQAFDVIPPSIGNSAISSLKNNAITGQLTAGMKNYLDVTGRVNGKLMFVTIGQKINEILKLKPKFPLAPAILSQSSYRLFGRDNSDYTKGIQTEQGVFALYSGSNAGIKLKTYLTLNENDALGNREIFLPSNSGGPDAFVGKLRKYGAVWKQEPNSDGSGGIVEPRVGFLGYMHQIAEINGKSDADISTTIGTGYTVCRSLLQNLLTKHGYNTIEDWLYDTSPAAFYPFDELQSLCLGKDASTAGLNESELSKLVHTQSTYDTDSSDLYYSTDSKQASGFDLFDAVQNTSDPYMCRKTGQQASDKEKELIQNALNAISTVLTQFFEKAGQKEAYLRDVASYAPQINFAVRLANGAVKTMDNGIPQDRDYPIFDKVSAMLNKAIAISNSWIAEAKRLGLI